MKVKRDSIKLCFNMVRNIFNSEDHWECTAAGVVIDTELIQIRVENFDGQIELGFRVVQGEFRGDHWDDWYQVESYNKIWRCKVYDFPLSDPDCIQQVQEEIINFVHTSGIEKYLEGSLCKPLTLRTNGKQNDS